MSSADTSHLPAVMAHSAPVSDGRYNGKVLAISDGVVSQKIGRSGEIANHFLSRLSAAVVPGDVVDIVYKNGTGIVSGHAAGLHR